MDRQKIYVLLDIFVVKILYLVWINVRRFLYCKYYSEKSCI